MKTEKHGSVPTSPLCRDFFPQIYKISGYKVFNVLAPSAIAISCLTIIFSSKNTSHSVLAISLILIIGVISAYYFSSTVILHSDRITFRNIFSEHTMYKNEIDRVEIREMQFGDSTRKMAYFVSNKKLDEEVILPTHAIQFNDVLHEWVASIIGDDHLMLEQYRETYKPKWFGFRAPD